MNTFYFLFYANAPQEIFNEGMPTFDQIAEHLPQGVTFDYSELMETLEATTSSGEPLALLDLGGYAVA